MHGMDRLDHDDQYTATSWLRGGRDPEWIAAELGTAVDAIEACRRRGHFGFVPSPSEIERLTRKIRATWTDAERRTRASTRRQGEHVAGVDAAAIREYVPVGDGFVMVE